MPLNVNFAMLTDPGRVRSSNQDACAADPAAGLYVVCDGMGGAAGGEIASSMSADLFLDIYTHNPQLALEDVLHRINEAVYKRSMHEPELYGMGTTLVALVLQSVKSEDGSETETAVHIAHVGDSRAYLWRAGQLHQLTQDHSLVEEQFRAGQITREQAERASYRNIITRAIGSFPTLEPELNLYRYEPDDLFLLASDGLNRELDDPAIAEILKARGTDDLLGVCHALVDATNESGGRDNVTVLLVHFA